jgi:subfamily B ATP-binding cassette protein MsbA
MTPKLFKRLASDDTLALVKRLMRDYMRPYIRTLGVALIFMAVSAGMTAAFAGLLEPVLDKVLIAVDQNQSRTDQIVPMAGLVFATFFINGIATYIYVILTNRISQSIIADIQKDLFSHFMRLDLSFFHSYGSSQLVSRVISDAHVMRTAVTDALIGIGKNVLTVICLIGVMFWQDWRLALIALCVFPLASLAVVYLGQRLRKLSRRIQNETANLMGVLGEIFSGIRQVQAHAMEDYERKRSADAVNKVRDLNIKSVRIGNLSTPLNEVLIGMALFGIIVYGGYSVAGGHLSPGELLSFIAAFTLAYEPVKKLAKLNNSLQKGLGAAERVLAMLDTQPRIQDAHNTTRLHSDRPRIVFDNVSFGYADCEDYAIEAIHLECEPGTMTALVGPSGSGKTTVMNLIPRLYDVSAGAITVDHYDIRDIKLRDLRAHISLVSQDITIFQDSIGANIAYGKLDATQDEIEQAARAAAAHDFIKQLPAGYATQLGENGIGLSGGQRQRIAIARAMLRDAPILLLDEVTSSLDRDSEALVQQSLETLRHGRTTLVIAHRPSTVKAADKIIVLDDGKVIETGTHETLLARNGFYRRLYGGSDQFITANRDA